MELYNERDLGPLFNLGQLSNTLTFINLGSGSSGNCYILSSGEDSILLDAGIGIRLILKHFKTLQIKHQNIRAIFITHDHADHTRGAIRLAYKLDIPIYATPLVARSLLYHRNSTHDLNAYLRVTQVGSTVEIGVLRVTSFEVPHDATHNVGYSIDTPHGVFVLVTDIGHITPEITNAISQANYLVFESNYDEEMLRTGPYPFHLKQRICSGLGHISNTTAAKTLAKHYHKGLRFLALCHISKDNNIPELALSEIKQTLEANGINCESDLILHTLNRSDPQEFTLHHL